MPTIPVAGLQSLVERIFHANGSSQAEGARIAHYLVSANLAGHDSHGVVRVPRYVDWQREGVVVADRTPTFLVDTPALALIDGGFGFGQTIAPLAVEAGVARCRAQGLAAVALRNCGHIGRVGDWAELAAAAGFVSIHFVNVAGSELVAPFGGVDRRFSTAPFCIGVPREGEAPLILDFATSLVAEGKVLVASRGGKKLPADALVTPQGEISADPATLYGPLLPGGPRNYREGKGAIRAFGEHKGSGLAFMCEMLAGALTGNGAANEQMRFSNGMLSFYLDPARIDAGRLFPAEMARYSAYVKSARPIDPASPVLLPGEAEEAVRRKRRAEGVPLSDEVWASILDAGRRAGIAERDLPD